MSPNKYLRIIYYKTEIEETHKTKWALLRPYRIQPHEEETKQTPHSQPFVVVAVAQLSPLRRIV